jgi:ribosomal protein S18 acetylase RimI-like enzyme
MQHQVIELMNRDVYQVAPCLASLAAAHEKINRFRGIHYPTVDPVLSLKRLTENVRLEKSRVLIVRVADEVAGFVEFSKTDTRGDIDRLSVLPQYRNQGIAQALMTQALHELAATTTLVNVHVLIENEAAQHLYQKFGFAERLVVMTKINNK